MRLRGGRIFRRFSEKVLPGTGRAKHPGNDFLSIQRLICRMLRPYSGIFFLGNLLSLSAGCFAHTAITSFSEILGMLFLEGDRSLQNPGLQDGVDLLWDFILGTVTRAFQGDELLDSGEVG